MLLKGSESTASLVTFWSTNDGNVLIGFDPFIANIGSLLCMKDTSFTLIPYLTTIVTKL